MATLSPNGPLIPESLGAALERRFADTLNR
ncbi:MAG: hypothetical protein AVDCRST_MAG73-47 [uncultured Thermomicrobiales bacterium]|uniref:Uncharacterized protein n=1 Tax=uncultured Thermomicrobiales bacterium TaxID=1645740 RepID=A0A6J4TBU8_9BACT|nr:MAG: hypothetical protein AVDCRST_MAG73-47 [uncultured Thermomicrobiales bacterium]